MPAALFPVVVPSIYLHGGHPVPLPKSMALASADMKAAIAKLSVALAAAGGQLVLSDLFRSYDMQLQAHNDYVSGKKSAFSPPPGGSFHEAGRAFDLDLRKIGMPLKDFWDLAAPFGLVPIIAEPDRNASEAWHFEHRGSHQRVYDYYRAGKGANFSEPYKAAAASAILAAGVRVDLFGAKQATAYLQSGLIRLGAVIGNIDGDWGPKTRDGLKSLGLPFASQDAALKAVENALQKAFPEEYFDASPLA